jgi:hypothetical protein
MKNLLITLLVIVGLGILSEIARDVWEYFHPRYEMGKAA